VNLRPARQRMRMVRGVHVLTVLHIGEPLGPEPNDFETKFAGDKFTRYRCPNKSARYNLHAIVVLLGWRH
jgi:hypothetical protein